MNFTHPARRRRPAFFALIGLLLALVKPFPTAANTQSTVPATIPTLVIAGHPYVSIEDLAAALSARIEYVSLKDKVLLHRANGPDLVFTVLSSVYLVGAALFRAPYPTRVENGKFYVSADVASQLRLLIAKPQPRVEGLVVSPPQPKKHQAPSGEVLKKRWAIDRIAIDAGHGGKDPGAVGPGGTREKDITLAVAKRLGEKLRKALGVEVVYTRTTDVFVKLGRTRIAREAKADLFISLHCNAGKRRGAGGIEVYFLSEAKTDAAAEVARRENAAFEIESDEPVDEEMKNTLQGIKLGILSSQYLKESQDLAATIRSSLVKRFKNLDDRGVKQANFYVLRGTMGSMPSVLVEMGFISNPKEEKLLKKGSFQKDMAVAIFEGIRLFKRTHERQLSNTP